MLRKLEHKDAKNMLECLTDPNVNSFMNIDGSKMTIHDCKEFILESSINESTLHYAIADKFGNWVGTISLKNIDYKVGQAEYAIITSSKVHGTGIAIEATKELLDIAFNKIKLNRVYLDVVKENIRANRFYLKCGFKYEGCFRQSIVIKGKIFDVNWYSILKNEYLSVMEDFNDK